MTLKTTFPHIPTDSRVVGTSTPAWLTWATDQNKQTNKRNDNVSPWLVTGSSLAPVIYIERTLSAHSETSHCEQHCKSLIQVIARLLLTVEKVVWPKGQGTSFRSWGLRVRVPSRSKFLYFNNLFENFRKLRCNILIVMINDINNSLSTFPTLQYFSWVLFSFIVYSQI